MNLLAHSFVHQKSSGCSCFLCSEVQKLKWSVWRSWLPAGGSRRVSAPRLIRVVGRTQVHDSVGQSSSLLGGGQPGYRPPLSCNSHLHSLAGGAIHCQSQQQQVDPLVLGISSASFLSHFSDFSQESLCFRVFMWFHWAHQAYSGYHLFSVPWIGNSWSGDFH